MSDSDSDSSSSSSDVPEVQQKRAPARAKKQKTDGPKKPLSAYMFFCQKERPEIKAANPEATFGDLGRLLGDKWKSFTEDEKIPYKKKADQDKIRFQDEGGHAARTPKVAAKKGAKKKKDGPKRPLSAFMFFSKTNRPKIKEQNPEMNFADLGREIGAQWKAMTDGVKGKYQKMAEGDKVRYQNELAGVTAAPEPEPEPEPESESGSGSDSGSESD